MQGLMPRQHLASQAPVGTSSQAQISALAALHARIRRGKPAVVSELRVRGHDLHLGAHLQKLGCQLSPSGDCAVAVWGKRGHPDTPPVTTGVQILGRHPDGAVWGRAPACTVPTCSCRIGWSSDGRFCAAISETGTYSVEQQTTLTVAGAPDLIIRVFDSQLGIFLPELPMDSLRLDDEEGSVSFSDDATLVTADCCYMPGSAHRELLVFEVSHASVAAIRWFCVTEPISQSLWLPGTATLAVLGGLPPSLLCIDVRPWPSSARHSYWAPLPFASPDCMAASPDGHLVWVVHCPEIDSPEPCFCISVWAAATMACQDSWSRAVGPGHLASQAPHRPCAHVAHCCLAISLHGNVCIFELAEGRKLGELQYCVDMQGVALSPDTSFLLGYGSDHIGQVSASVRVLHLCSATYTDAVQPLGLKAQITAVSWGADASQVLTASRLPCQTMVFSVHQY